MLRRKSRSETEECRAGSRVPLAWVWQWVCHRSLYPRYCWRPLMAVTATWEAEGAQARWRGQCPMMQGPQRPSGLGWERRWEAKMAWWVAWRSSVSMWTWEAGVVTQGVA